MKCTILQNILEGQPIFSSPSKCEKLFTINIDFKSQKKYKESLQKSI